MGHDISAIQNNKVVASIRISGLHRYKTKLYKVLRADKFNRRDSGSGGSKKYNALELLESCKNSGLLTHVEADFISLAFQHCRQKDIEILFA